MRWPQRVATGAALTAVLAGPPLVLVRTVGWPLPTRITADQARTWIREPLTEDTLIAGIAVLAWMFWLFLASLATRAALTRAQAALRRVRRMPLPTPMQATATGMAGAAAIWTPTTPATAAPADAPPATTSSTGDHHTTPDQAHPGVEVPGGWIPADTAQLIAAAAALVWLRRRRDYRPQPPGTRTDTDLTPLPTTVTTVQTALATAPTPSLMGPAVEFPDGGVGLTGPGAADAARGILITTLLQALRGAGRSVTVVTSRADLHTLLGPGLPPLDGLPGLTVTDTLDEAVTIARQATDPDGPQPLLLTHLPAHPTTRAPLTTGLAQAKAVLIGTWPHHPTWHITPDGHTQHREDGTSGRLCVLNATAALDLLTVLAPTTPPAVAVPRQQPPTPAPQPPSPGRKPLTLYVLGEVTLHFHDTPVPIRRSAALQTLVALAVHPDGATTRTLATAIWPGLPPTTTSRRLYTTLSELRTTITTTTNLDPIEHTGDRYRLNPQHIDTDLWRLRTAVDHAANTLTDRPIAVQSVINHYTGDLATSHTWPWLAPFREATRRHVLDAHIALAGTTPEPSSRLLLLQDALRIDPYNQHLHHLAADALTVLGKHHDANALLTRYQQRLAAAEGLSS
ncbi:AfsR/SARP family transcriptional regulator [Micromonospora fluostatini]|uniref:AfsR/SARP family transcriptional regulator n=1 Tax=Micromonospora sp. JCM 30529 TaxID=3421643 RepID=UPI003D185BAA